jgi:hypothetical protein
VSTEKGSVTETLRRPFKPEEIGKLPRVTCPKCSDPKKNGPCGEHSKSRCQTCGAYVSERHIHLDYVGHADVTSRLLEADPEWAWEPAARDIDPQLMAAALATGNPEIVRTLLENSPPKFDLDDRGGPVGLWIRLTVGDVTRPRCGSAWRSICGRRATAPTPQSRTRPHLAARPGAVNSGSRSRTRPRHPRASAAQATASPRTEKQFGQRRPPGPRLRRTARSMTRRRR